MRRWAYKARNMHTFLKTAYVHFRLPSLVERAHIPRESISARLPAFPLHPCLPQPLIDHLSFSRSLFPPLHRFTPSPSHSYFLMGCAPSSVPCTVYHPLYRVEWSTAERSGMERCGRPPLMNVILRRGRAEYGRPLSSFGTSTPLSTTHSLSPRQSPSCSPHPTFSSINFHHVNLPTSPSFLYLGSYVSPKSTHNYKTFNLNVKLKRNGFSSVSTVAIKSACSVSPDDCVQIRDIRKNVDNEKVFIFLHIALSYCTIEISLYLFLFKNALLMDIRVIKMQVECIILLCFIVRK